MTSARHGRPAPVTPTSSVPRIGEKDSRLFGLLRRKQIWLPSWQGSLLLVVLAAGASWLFLLHAYSFLAINSPVETDILVVEGWVQNYGIRSAVEVFTSGHYKAVYSTGGPVPGTGGYTNDFNTSASVGAERLIASGIPRDLVHTVASRDSARDRTYGSALALKRWFEEHGIDTRAINVMTETTHARRSRLLYQMALGPEIKVGIIPMFNPDFNPEYWWRYSDGVRDVIGESLAYVYAKLFFWPDEHA